MKVVIGIAELQDSYILLLPLKTFPWPAETDFRVLSVADKVHPSMLEVMGTTVEDVQRKADLHASAAATSIAAELSEAGFHAEAETVGGNPKSAILDFAKQWGADLIVVGAKDNGHLKEALLGSVATAVVTGAKCSVLVIRAAPEETAA